MNVKRILPKSAYAAEGDLRNAYREMRDSAIFQNVINTLEKSVRAYQEKPDAANPLSVGISLGRLQGAQMILDEIMVLDSTVASVNENDPDYRTGPVQ